MSSATRVAALRQRHKDAGRVPVTVYVLPEHRKAVKALERGLQASESRQQPAAAPGTPAPQPA